MSNDTIKATYTMKDDVTGVMKGINKSLENNEKQVEKNSKSVEKMGTAAKVAAVAIGAFLVKQTIEATTELSKLGAKAALVDKNFRQFALNTGKNSDEMLKSLRKATLGMVDDMTLQQNAMKAMISGVSFDDMKVAMEFVTKFAAATGEDVGVKMQSVMTGLARKSAQFMDDVGIQVMGASDVVRASIDQMQAKMGQFATSEEDAAIQMEAFAAEMRNAANELSQALLPVLQKVLPLMTKMANVANEVASGIAAITNQTVKKNEAKAKEIESLGKLKLELGDVIKKYDTMQDKGFILTSTEEEHLISAIEKYDEVSEKLKKLTTTAQQAPKKVVIPTFETAGGKKEKKAKIALGDVAGPEEDTMEKSKAAILEFQAFIVAQEQEAADKRKEIIKEIELFGLTATQTEIKRINDEFSEKKSLFQSHTEEYIALEQERIDRINEVKDADKEKTFESSQEAISFAVDTAMQINSLIEQAFASRFARERSEIDSTTAKRRGAIKESTMSEKQKNKELAKLDKEAAKEKHEIAMSEWRTNLIMAVANTALGVTKALSSSSPPLNFVMAALTGAAGAASIATIASNKPKFAEGGVVPGNSFTGDQVTIGANSGERVLTNSQQNRLDDFFQGRGNVGQSRQAPSLTIGDTTTVINGPADDSTIAAIEAENESHREKIIEAVYVAFEKNEFDTTRTPFITA